MMDITQHDLVRIFHVGRIFECNRAWWRFDFVVVTLVRVVGDGHQETNAKTHERHVEQKSTDFVAHGRINFDRLRLSEQSTLFFRIDYQWFGKNAQPERVAGFDHKLVQLGRVQLGELILRAVGRVADQIFRTDRPIVDPIELNQFGILFRHCPRYESRSVIEVK